MGLADRALGKTADELIIMDLGDISHTLKKKKVGETDTQVAYCLEVLDDCIKRLKEKQVCLLLRDLSSHG